MPDPVQTGASGCAAVTLLMKSLIISVTWGWGGMRGEGKGLFLKLGDEKI